MARAILRAQQIEAESLISVLDLDQRAELQSLLEQLDEHLVATPQLIVASGDTSQGTSFARTPIGAGKEVSGIKQGGRVQTACGGSDGDRRQLSTIPPTETPSGAERTSRRAS